MWILRSERGQDYLVSPDKTHCVSRKDGDLLLPDDQSISRKHAFLQVHPSGSAVLVWDAGSKYGTFVNNNIQSGVKLDVESKVSLNQGDHVRFGLQWNTWKLAQEPLEVCASTLTDGEKSELQNLLKPLGGSLNMKWSNRCTHLTMSSITLTVKVVCALACARPIVTLLFWKHFYEALSQGKARPKPSNFVPPLAEDLINKDSISFLADARRSTLFKNKLFVFPTPEILKKLKCMVECGGGTACDLINCELSKEQLLQPNVIVILHNVREDQQSHQYRSIVRLLRQKGIRVIPDSEIGLSILHVSLSVYCNPLHKTRVLHANRTSQMASQSENITLVADTEELSVADASQVMRKAENVVIPASGTSSKANCQQTSTASLNTSITSVAAGACTSSSTKTDRTTLGHSSSSQKRSRNSLSEESSPIKKIPKNLNTTQIKAEKVEDDTFAFPEQPRRAVKCNTDDEFALPDLPMKNNEFACERNGVENVPNASDNDFIFPEVSGNSSMLNGTASTLKKQKLSLSSSSSRNSSELNQQKATPIPDCLNKSDEDMFDFQESSEGISKPSPSLKKKSVIPPQNKPINEASDLNVSADIFGRAGESFQRQEEEPTSSQPSNAKRKSRDDDLVNCAVSKKRALGSKQESSMHCIRKSVVGPSSGWLIRRDAVSCVKEEIKDEMDPDQDDISYLLDKVNIRFIPVIASSTSSRLGQREVSANSKNYKKFKKVWRPPQERHVIRGEDMMKVGIGGGDMWLSFHHYEEEDTDNPSVSPFNANHQNNGSIRGDNNEDEWAF